MPHDDLEARWAKLWSALGANGDPSPVARDLLARWTTPARVYHDIGHLRHCLRELDSVTGLATEPVCVETALWLHDAVYDPMMPDNEDQSIALWQRIAERAAIADPRTRRVAELVAATKHEATALDDDAKLVVDIDLAILGQAEPVFDAYEAAVAREYDWVPEDLFRSTRARILRRFAERPAIYATPTFRERYEAHARANIARSLRTLGL